MNIRGKAANGDIQLVYASNYQGQRLVLLPPLDAHNLLGCIRVQGTAPQGVQGLCRINEHLALNNGVHLRPNHVISPDHDCVSPSGQDSSSVYTGPCGVSRLA